MINKLKPLLWTLLACAAITTAGLGSFIFYLHQTLQQDTTSYLQEVAKRSVKILNNQISADLNTLTGLANILADRTEQEFNQYPWTRFLQQATRQNAFSRLGLALPNGTAYLSDGFIIDISQRDFFQRALETKEHVSGLFPASPDKEKVILLSVPVEQNGQVKALLFTAQSTQDYGRLIAGESFDGEGYSLIVTKNGDKIAISDPNKTDLFSNIFLSPQNAGLDKEGKMATDMQNNRSGWRYFHHPQEGWLYVSYEPTGVNDWYLLSVVPRQTAAQKANQIFILSSILCISGLLVFLALLFFIYRQNLQTREKLYKAAYTDPLTGGYTWAKARQEIRRLLCVPAPPKYAFVIFDINKFKVANEILGYEKANDLLRHIGQVLQEEIKSGEEFSRVQADVFQMLLIYTSAEALKNRLELLNEKITHSASFTQGHFQLLLSFGVFPIQQCPTNINDLLVKAALARDTVKGKYNEIVAFYDKNFQKKIEKEQQIQSNMEQALSNKEISLSLQAICSISGDMQAAEVHARWYPPGQTPIEEETFREVFSKNGFISQLDIYMAEKACHFLNQRRQNGKELFPLALSLSIDSLHTPQFSAILRKLVQKYNIPPRYLWLQAAPQKGRIDKAVVKLLADRLHKEGFILTLDQMGKGTTSLELLKILPVDMIKLEEEIIKGLESNAKARAIVSSLVYMVKSLGLKIIFSGVNSPQQLEILRTLGADLFTGPLCGKDPAEQ